MLSALQANLFAASRMALAMATDHTLPNVLSKLHSKRKTPVWAILTTSAIVIVVLLIVPDVAAAGAAASLIFLITFAVANLISILIRQRTSSLAKFRNSENDLFRAPFFPAIPIVATLACVALAVFQGVTVPSAGVIASFWLAFGGLLFLGLFAHRARVVDASSESLDPDMLRLRGRSPLVLVPVANPDSAEAMVVLANALVPRDVGRVMLLSIVVTSEGWHPDNDPAQLANIQSVWAKALNASLAADAPPEVLTTIASDPWSEIIRVARLHRCENVLLGMTKLDDESTDNTQVTTASDSSLDKLLGALDCNVVIFRTRQGLNLESVHRILVPVGGRRGHDELRARTLGSLTRTGQREIIYLRVMPEVTSPKDKIRALRNLLKLARYETRGRGTARVLLRDSIEETVIEQAADVDLLILGSQRLSRRRKLLGDFTLRVASQTNCAMIVISRRG